MIGNLTVGKHLEQSAYDTSNGILYVADEASDSVFPLNTSTLTASRAIGAGMGPIGVAFDSFNGLLYDFLAFTFLLRHERW